MAEFCEKCFREIFRPSQAELRSLELSAEDDLDLCEGCGAWTRYVVKCGVCEEKTDIKPVFGAERERDAIRAERRLSPLHSSGWGQMDHAHICLAARLLADDDYISVCPAGGECHAEWDDCCDACDYLKILSFDREGDRKTIRLE